MLSNAGLSGGASVAAKPKALGLAPPPAGGVKIRSPLPPPPNDPVAARITAVVQENSRRSSDPLSDLSQLEVCILPHWL